MTTTFRDFKSASAICWRTCSASGRTSMVGMMLGGRRCPWCDVQYRVCFGCRDCSGSWLTGS
jgi:hypothetical protein